MPECPKVESPIVHTTGRAPACDRAVGHRDRRAHVHRGVDGAVGGQHAQRVATDVAEQDRLGVGRRGLDDGAEAVGVWAAAAQLGRSSRQTRTTGSK